ncbi:MAG: hypothetical protein AAFX04_11525 [Pseudomonadota bacterium]
MKTARQIISAAVLVFGGIGTIAQAMPENGDAIAIQGEAASTETNADNTHSDGIVVTGDTRWGARDIARGCLWLRHIRRHEVTDDGQLDFIYKRNQPVRTHFTRHCEGLTKRSIVAYGIGPRRLCVGNVVGVGTRFFSTDLCQISGFSFAEDLEPEDEG